MGRWSANDPVVQCDEPATVCSECVRALALKWWGGIARHGPEPGFDTCTLCETGVPSYCGIHAVDAVAVQREALIENGARIGEPSW